MARPRSPKKNTEVKENPSTLNSAVPGNGSQNNPLPLSDATFRAAEVSSSVAVAEAPAPTETKPEARKTIRKPEIVRSETRANLVPINVEEEVRRLAYLLAERRGFEPGHEAEDWLAAEREIRQRYRQQSA